MIRLTAGDIGACHVRAIPSRVERSLYLRCLPIRPPSPNRAIFSTIRTYLDHSSMVDWDQCFGREGLLNGEFRMVNLGPPCGVHVHESRAKENPRASDTPQLPLDYHYYQELPHPFIHECLKALKIILHKVLKSTLLRLNNAKRPASQ